MVNSRPQAFSFTHAYALAVGPPPRLRLIRSPLTVEPIWVALTRTSVVEVKFSAVSYFWRLVTVKQNVRKILRKTLVYCNCHLRSPHLYDSHFVIVGCNSRPSKKFQIWRELVEENSVVETRSRKLGRDLWEAPLWEARSWKAWTSKLGRWKCTRGSVARNYVIE